MRKSLDHDVLQGKSKLNPGTGMLLQTDMPKLQIMRSRPRKDKRTQRTKRL